jgi:hypothetical protein
LASSAPFVAAKRKTLTWAYSGSVESPYGNSGGATSHRWTAGRFEALVLRKHEADLKHVKLAPGVDEIRVLAFVISATAALPARTTSS